MTNNFWVLQLIILVEVVVPFAVFYSEYKNHGNKLAAVFRCSVFWAAETVCATALLVAIMVCPNPVLVILSLFILGMGAPVIGAIDALGGL